MGEPPCRRGSRLITKNPINPLNAAPNIISSKPIMTRGGNDNGGFPPTMRGQVVIVYAGNATPITPPTMPPKSVKSRTALADRGRAPRIEASAVGEYAITVVDEDTVRPAMGSPDIEIVVAVNIADGGAVGSGAADALPGIEEVAGAVVEPDLVAAVAACCDQNIDIVVTIEIAGLDVLRPAVSE